MIPFKLSDVRSLCDSDTFSRGYDCNAAQLSVITAVKKISPDVMQITATTQGTDLYKQTINIYNRGDNIKILGQCSCYVGINCKHIVSSSLTHLDSIVDLDPVQDIQSENNDSSIDQWMQELLEAEAHEDESFTTSTVLLYELRRSRSMIDIDMTLFTARVLKGGGYGKVNKARPNAIFSNFSMPDYLRQSDKEAIPFFKVLSGGKDASVSLRGKIGALLLESVLKTGRCFWQRSHKDPLTFSTPRMLMTRWIDIDGHSARLGFDIGAESFLIHTEPLYYCDAKAKKIGQVESDLNAKQLAVMKKAPAVSSEEKETFSQKLSQHLPHIHLPADRPMTLIEDIKPKAILTFLANKKQHALSLSFEYDGYEIDALPLRLSTFIEDKNPVRIIRHQEREKEYLGRLLGFSFIIDKNILIPDSSLNQTQKIKIWHTLMEAKTSLEEEGFEIRTDKSFLYTFEDVTVVDVSVEAKSHWFDVSMHIDINGQSIPLLPIISQLLEDKIPLDELPKEMHFAISDTQFIRLDASVFRPILKTVYELFSSPTGNNLQLSSYDAVSLENLQTEGFSFRNKTQLTELSQKLQTLDTMKASQPPKGLKATLREYQTEGLTWLSFLRQYQLGGILADDMGLGKTIQTLAHLLAEKEAGRLTKPVLIVAPTSLLGNWKKEALAFTPDLKVVISHGNSRDKVLENLDQYDLIVTTYTLMVNDLDRLMKYKFYYLILDEAQKIKNSRSQATQAAKKIVSEHFLALTGTPMENHLGELWSIFDVVSPGLLGSLKFFKSLYQIPIEKEHDQSRQTLLNKRIQPFMMRRTKEKVASELPAKTEILRTIPFENTQATLYETIRVSMEKKVRDTIKEMGLSKSHITILDALLKLRQVCCDPRLLKMDEAQNIEQSAKLTALMDLVIEMIEEGRKILIFSQFTSMLEIIAQALNKKNLGFAKLTGSTTNREKVIESFQNGEVDIFLISLKAGGVGLNLTQADTVIHYDPWWNPAAEDQATDRAYRIGQDKPVFVYKLIIENSVEEKIVAMQEDKRSLANNLYDNANEGMKSLDSKSLLELFEKSK